MQALAPDSEGRLDPDDGSWFIAGVGGNQISVSKFEPKCIVMTDAEDEAVFGDIRDVLAIIDRNGLDPVRLAVVDFLDALHANDDTKGMNVGTLDALDKLEALL